MQVTIDLPDDYLIVNKNYNEIAQDIKLNNALIIYRQGKASISKASELAGLNVYQFIDECNKNSIPVVDYSADELYEELKTARKLI